MRLFPALDLTLSEPGSDDELGRILALVDDEGPTAVEERPSGLRVFFASAAARDRAAARLGAGVAIDVADEDWAERSQAALGPVRVGDIVVAPPWCEKTSEVIFPKNGKNDLRGLIVIQPSMGFGTGHHASTRLCLALLQRRPVAGRRVLDIGTGSGVLALAAWKLHAASVLAIDSDPDAIASAAENLERNRASGGVVLQVLDLVTLTDSAETFDLIFANLTGAVLMRFAATIAARLPADGRLILSGIQTDEASSVEETYAARGCDVVERLDEDGWTGFELRPTSPTPSTTR